MICITSDKGYIKYCMNCKEKLYAENTGKQPLKWVIGCKVERCVKP